MEGKEDNAEDREEKFEIMEDLDGKHEDMRDEEKQDVDDVEYDSSDSFIDDDFDENEASASGQDEGPHSETPFSEEEIEDLISDFLEVESKAAEAQESLEEESLAKLELEVREELSKTLHGNELEAAVADEMTTFKDEWHSVLDDLEIESAQLLEQLDGTGIELPSLFKWIESQAPDGCSTETWRKRTQWVGSQVTSDVSESVGNAERYLQSHRPVRRRHGKLLEEGASGFLAKKVATAGNSETVTENPEVDWCSLNKIFSDGQSGNDTSFGSKNWASVYLASTPQQAAELGLQFPGVNQVEEIEDIDGGSGDPFFAAALANEKELKLSEEQRKNFRKVKEEEDANVSWKLQLHLKQRRHKTRRKWAEEVISVEGELDASARSDENNHEPACSDMKTEPDQTSNDMDKKLINGINELGLPDVSEGRGLKRSRHSEEIDIDTKVSQIVVVDCDDEFDAREKYTATNAENQLLQENCGASVNENFHCTACNKVIVSVHQHPLLKAIVCKDCKFLMETKMQMQVTDCSECYCGWCGRSKDLINCKSCNTLFCTACIKRNIGEECLSRVQAFRWTCCCCSTSLLEPLALEFEKAAASGALLVSSSDSDSDYSDAGISVSTRSKRKQKKRIRRILDDAELGEETKRKIAIEKERQDRLKSLQVQFPCKSTITNTSSCSGNLLEGASVEVLGDALSGYIVNVVREKGEDAVRVPPSISAKLKVHQVAGIRFLWENIIQSIRKVKSGDKGLGCILAHTMGLGKTFQVIAFLYTAMRSVDMGLKTALIVTPVNVLHNWRQEFIKWRPSELKPLRVLMLEDVSRERRSELLAKWKAKGGVFLISYAAFRNLSLGKNVKYPDMAREISFALQEGPDILVCDEAHIIKNTKAETTQALNLVRCQRRIALTGSPLQNNLMEYYCMVDFVRQGFLGSSHEFRNRFQNPIENGQHTNSTSDDVKIMNQRSHILYEQLKGFVQRMDMNVVKKDLPPKTVLVIAVKLSTLQRRLYKRFLDLHGFTNDKVSNENIKKRSFFEGYQALAQIWNHPGILQLRKDERDFVRHDDVENFLVDDSSSDDNLNYNTVPGDKPRNKNEFLQRRRDISLFPEDWWNDTLQENIYKEVDYSGKMVLLLDMLTMCSEVGDKALVFSQSILTLDLIEIYLSKLPRPGKQGKCWKQGKDWYRLDGKTQGSERQKLVERFNESTNRRVKCTLISTRAGSLGINLHAANRVIILDGSWNPTYDLQAIYRAWRYGQRKPVFAYRFLAHGTMEEKIYKRQVTKEGLAARVVDKQQVYRTMSKEEILHLFEFGDDEIPDTLSKADKENEHIERQISTGQNGNFCKQKLHTPQGSCSSDKLMESLLGSHYPRWIANYHEHETLLQENEEEKLSKEEQDMAWELYQRSFEWEEVHQVPVDFTPAMPNGAHQVLADLTPAIPNVATPPAPQSGNLSEPKRGPKNHLPLRKCTKLSHMLTLRSQGTKVGCSTVCGECAREISWKDLNGEGKSRSD